jgi:hypothetical protein
MALPLTVKTEPAIVNRPRYLPNMDTDQRIEDLGTEADLHTPIDHLEVPREPEMTTMRIEAEETLDDSKFTTKMLPKTIRAALEYPTKT